MIFNHSGFNTCENCGRLTERPSRFCTTQCRMEDSDLRIEEVEEERDKYKEALELITDYGCTGEDARDMREIAINALQGL